MNFKANKGMSLTELIVASVLIGIVMLGVISFTSSLKSIQGSTSNSTIPSVKLSSVMFEISKDASLVIGDQLDSGIEEDDAIATPYLCLRQDNDGAGTSNITPDDYSDDTWVCYLMDNANTLHKCIDANFSNCVDGSTTPQFPDLITLSQNSFFDVIDSGTPARIEHIHLDLRTRNVPTDAVHPINNPEFTLETNISPLSLGR
ncbi:MAG: prepilin-type N-terminal cleavage/methylation domain-containing protein [Candidatus Omnitrophica bacterium]|nr:prepilin-type N-terminal cleavage/methylation domain-containing protein [Candidatus Omnitrophota bacterium]MBU1995686.1 prepilin-type N-terminal cleavage/methylation domain-containing protein [Candidatus Omnitrophota bacterium]MBU4333021.1 prepilin-type N-terminal cleavage/methylation domain-containing protein [Candidatus Omnitrophota bacterium]